MPCYYPMQAYRARSLNESGKRGIVFSLKDGYQDMPVTLPCGQCIGCRLERSRQWAVRCVHEAQMYDDNCFITLTYSNDFLPPDGSLSVRDFQLFMKRLRKRFGDGIRFFHCGEYGEKFRRPHYHALLFNFDFVDKTLWKEVNGQKLYRSKALEELWPYGHSSVGTATFESAAYVARYIMKKVNGDDSFLHYANVDVDTGEVLSVLKPEYTTMSRRPGIGKAWFDKFGSDVFPRDEVVVRGKKMRPPKYYDSVYELIDPDDALRIKVRRRAAAKVHSDDCTPERLHVRRVCKERQIKSLVRNVDKEL